LINYRVPYLKIRKEIQARGNSKSQGFTKQFYNEADKFSQGLQEAGFEIITLPNAGSPKQNIITSFGKRRWIAG
jgi:hypothetical protein